MSSDCATSKAALAAPESPVATASSKRRKKVRTLDRRAELTAVRFAILRIAFLAPGLLAIGSETLKLAGRVGQETKRDEQKREAGI